MGAAARALRAILSIEVATEAAAKLRGMAALLVSSLLCPSAALSSSRLASRMRLAPAVRKLRGGSPSASAIAVMVDVEVKEDRLDEFLEVMKIDAEGSRKEAGCLRFDVLRSQDKPTRFFFYEVYESADAVAVHKAEPHFKYWSDFKESGGCVSSVSTKCDLPDFGFTG